MSRNLLRYTTNIPLQGIAEQIITEQTKSIENMQAIMDTCKQNQNHPREVRAY